MSKITWIIEKIAGESSYHELETAALKAGHRTIVLDKNYKGGFATVINTKVVTFNGSIEMAKQLKREFEFHSLFCAIYCSFENYRCSKYYSYFGDLLFNDKYAIVTLSELNRNLYYYYGLFGKDAVLFIRPDSGEKTFQAQLVDIIDFNKFFLAHQDIKHDLIVISTPKNIVGEWRIVCSKTEIIDYSLYRYQGQTSKIHAAPKNVLDFARQILDVGYHPDEVFCVDVSTDEDNNCWLMELTSFSSAGLYATNKDIIVDKVSKIAFADFNKKF